MQLRDSRFSQQELGIDVVLKRAEKIKKKWVRKGITIEDQIRDRANKKAPIPVFISPKGEYFVTDGHHLLATTEHLLGRNHNFQFIVKVEKDYRMKKQDGEEWTYREFEEDFLSSTERGGQGKGYFLAENRTFNADYKMRTLPRHLEEYIDNPYRSAVGFVFKKYGLSGRTMIDYIQFLIGEIMHKNEFYITESTVNNPQLLRDVANFMFGHEEAYNYLFNAFRTPELKERHQREVSKAREVWKRSTPR